MAQIEIPRNDGRVDDRPCSDVHRCHVVGWPSEATPNTNKLVSGLTIASGFEPAFGADMRGSSRVYSNNRNTRKSCLVLDEFSQLPERPRVQVATLRLANRCLVSDAFEVFKGYRSTSVFGLRNEPLGDAMVDVPLKTPLSPSEAPEMALCALRPSGLESAPENCGPISHLVDLGAAVDFPITIDGEMHDAEVYPENASGVVFARLRSLDDHAEVEYTLPIDKVGLSAHPVQSNSLIVPNPYRYDFTAAERQNGDGFELSPREDALVVDHCAAFSELRLDVLVPLVRLADLGDGAHSHLSGESESFSHRVVYNLAEGDSIGSAFFECHFSYVVASLVKSLHGGQEHVVLFRGRSELDHQGLHHHIDRTCLSVLNFPQFLPPMNWGASLGVES